MGYPIVYLPTVRRYSTRYAAGDYLTVRRRSKQKAPYDVPTDYEAQYSTTVTLNSYGLAPSSISAPDDGGGFGIDSGFAAARTDLNDWANNSAYEKFVSKVREEAMLAVNWAERRQSMDMLLKRTDQLIRAASAMRRGNWRRMGEIFNVSVPPELRKRSRYRGPREMSNTWLEFHFGWEPLVKDIASAVNIIGGPAPSGKVFAPGRRASGTYSDAWDYPWIGQRWDYTRKLVVSGCYSARVHVSNPNVFLANQLGLLNPAAIAWELVPYSFVVDWFANVGAFLGSFTDFLGLTLVNSMYTRKVSCVWTGTTTYYLPTPNYYVSAVQRGDAFTRSVVVPSVRLALRPPRPIGAVRGFTAISLLLQKLPRV